MASRSVVTVSLWFVASLCVAWTAACGGGILKKDYEYEEEMYVALDGSATLNLNASVPALVALRGLDMDLDPRARLDRGRVRDVFEKLGVRPSRVSVSRRHGRRFVHLSFDVPDVRQLTREKPFAWSTYALARRGEIVEFRQLVGAAAGRDVGDAGWQGNELVAFRLHLPSRIPHHNAPSRTIERGNILTWEQPLSERLKGVPVDLEVNMEPESILYSTLQLFAATIVAALMTFALVIWWIARKGRSSEVADSPGTPA